MEDKLRVVSKQYASRARFEEQAQTAAGFHAAAIYTAISRALKDLADELAK